MTYEMLSGKPQLNRQINSALVLKLLQQHHSLSRADLARMTGIKPASMSAIMEDLLEQKLVREIGHGQSTGGRQPMMIEINPSGLYAAGIEIGEDTLNGVLLDLSGRALASESILLPNTAVDTIAKRGNELLDRLVEVSSIPRDKLASVGVAVPGNIDKKRALVVYSGPLQWKMVHLPTELASWHTNLHMLNNAMAGAMAEYFDTAKATQTKSMLYILIHLEHLQHYELTSIGCAIVLDGRAFYGEGQTAGEISMDIAHPLAIAKQLNLPTPATTGELVKLSLNEPKRYSPVWNEFATQLSRVAAWGMDLLSPGRIVIGVDMSDIDLLTEKAMRDYIHNNTVAGKLKSIEGVAPSTIGIISFTQLRQDTLARGAIIPQLQELCQYPLGRSIMLS